MSKDPRYGLKLRLSCEAAREIEQTPVIGPGVNDAAVRAVNSVLYQRLQEQIIDDNPTARILKEKIRDINITNIASETNINKAAPDVEARHPRTCNFGGACAGAVRGYALELGDRRVVYNRNEIFRIRQCWS